MTKNKFPPGWEEESVKRVLAHYEQQTDEDAVAEDEVAFTAATYPRGRRKKRKASCQLVLFTLKLCLLLWKFRRS